MTRLAGGIRPDLRKQIPATQMFPSETQVLPAPKQQVYLAVKEAGTNFIQKKTKRPKGAALSRNCWQWQERRQRRARPDGQSLDFWEEVEEGVDAVSQLRFDLLA